MTFDTMIFFFFERCFKLNVLSKCFQLESCPKWTANAMHDSETALFRKSSEYLNMISQISKRLGFLDNITDSKYPPTVCLLFCVFYPNRTVLNYPSKLCIVDFTLCDFFQRPIFSSSLYTYFFLTTYVMFYWTRIILKTF